MAIFRCKMCGGNLEVLDGTSFGICEFCETKQTLPTVSDEGLQTLFNRANVLRMKSEFDKAADIYEKILQKSENQAEAYWGLILCKYGIEYVEDPATYKRVPTCHRASFDAVISDEDYKNALKYADEVQRVIYENEAKMIDEIQKGIISLAQKNNPYDVFICYKETDENGKRTQDSVIANDIYHQLTMEGFKVFYAAITLEDKLGTEYEPYIFSALNTAKVMLAIGTKPEYFNAVWVKNEWARFLKIMKKDRTRLLIPCYRGMDPYELPEEFAHLQAQDMSKIGFINDLVRGIRKIIQDDEKTIIVKRENVVSSENNNISPLLKRVFMFLEDKEWESANEYCEKVLDIDPENAFAYLGKMLAELQVRKKEDLKHKAIPFDQNKYYRKTLRFADQELKNELTSYIEYITKRNEDNRLEGIYKSNIKKLNEGIKTEKEYKDLAKNFETISHYKNAADKVKECYEKAEIVRKDKILNDGKAKMNGDLIMNYESAIKLFKAIPSWRDADEMSRICEEKIDEIKAKREADSLAYKQKKEQERIEAEKNDKRNKKIFIIVSSVVVAVVAFLIIYNNVIIPNNKYKNAIVLMDEGKYNDAISVFESLDGHKDSTDKIEECKYNNAMVMMDEENFIEAYEALIALDDYKDSKQKANDIFFEYKVEKLNHAKVGDYVLWGEYEQDNDESNGKENIEWLVLDVKDDKILVISEYALERKVFDSTSGHIDWENSEIRKWLNNEFIDSSFTDEEKTKILTSKISADKNPECTINQGNSTQDKVFLLSVVEADKYFSSNSERQCRLTQYAMNYGGYSGEWYWWLRTAAWYNYYFITIDSIASVGHDGDIKELGGAPDTASNAIRPAMWIDLGVAN